MIYTASITVTKNTSESSPITQDIKVTNGIIIGIKTLFPSGCAGLVNVQFLMGAHPIAPSTKGQTFKGDNTLIEFPEFLDISDAPRYITVKAWNLDTLYDHTVEILITQLPPEAIPQMGFVEGIVKSLKTLFLRERS